MGLCQSQIDEVTATIVDDVVIANHLVTFLPDRHLVRPLLLVKSNVTVADANESLHDNV